jgi:hypothetical protein
MFAALHNKSKQQWANFRVLFDTAPCEKDTPQKALLFLGIDKRNFRAAAQPLDRDPPAAGQGPGLAAATRSIFGDGARAGGSPTLACQRSGLLAHSLAYMCISACIPPSFAGFGSANAPALPSGPTAPWPAAARTYVPSFRNSYLNGSFCKKWHLYFPYTYARSAGTYYYKRTNNALQALALSQTDDSRYARYVQSL